MIHAGERHPSKQWHYSTSQWKLRPAPLYPQDLGLKRGISVVLDCPLSLGM